MGNMKAFKNGQYGTYKTNPYGELEFVPYSNLAPQTASAPAPAPDPFSGFGRNPFQQQAAPTFQMPSNAGYGATSSGAGLGASPGARLPGMAGQPSGLKW